jgi:hypothetical protein
VREFLLDALGTGRSLMDWNPQCKPKLFDTFAKSQLKVKKEGVIMAEMFPVIRRKPGISPLLAPFTREAQELEADVSLDR